MADEPHEVVKLLLARMESHPEEFRLKDPSYHDRWYNHMSAINTYGSEADKAALAAKTRDIRLTEVHEQVMDELLNGDDRRRKEEEEAEYERNLATQGMLSQRQAQQQAQQAAQQQQAQQNAMMSQYKNAYANQLGQLGQYNQAQAVGLSGASPTSILKKLLGAK
jgi:hypothetical protein